MHCQTEPFICVVKSISNTLLLRGAANIDLRLWLTGAVDLVTAGIVVVGAWEPSHVPHRHVLGSGKGLVRTPPRRAHI